MRTATLMIAGPLESVPQESDFMSQEMIHQKLRGRENNGCSLY